MQAWMQNGRPVKSGNQGVLCGECPCGCFMFIAYGNGVFGYLNSKTWERKYKFPSRTTDWGTFSSEHYSIATNGNIWLTGGDYGYSGNGIFAYSADTNNWQYYLMDSIGRILWVRWNGEYWLASANEMDGPYDYKNARILRSYDGINWSIYDKTEYKTITNLTWSGEYWLASAMRKDNGNAFVLKSSDGINWDSYNVQDISGPLYSFAYNGYLWLGIGIRSGSIVGNFSSVDGINWVQRSTWSDFVSCITWNGEYWLGISSYRIMRSYDGINWEHFSNSLSRFYNYLVWNGSFWMGVCPHSYVSDPGIGTAIIFENGIINEYTWPWPWSGVMNINGLSSIPAPNLYPPIYKGGI